MKTPGDLDDIYRRKVLEHSRHPHNFGRPETTTHNATGYNPLCGDKVSIYLQIAEGTIRDATFEGNGCAICMASASMLTDALHGQTTAHAHRLISVVERMFTEGAPPDEAALKDMEALENVRHYPSRVKCATLAWTTVAAALNDETKPVTTEN